jgi:hypothetical protein
MAVKKLTSTVVGLGAVLALAGCSSGSSVFGFGDSSSALTTAALPESAKSDPACAGLTAQISSLRQEGVADKIEKAAAKKYKMTAIDLTKADQLTKANADYQAKCGTTKPVVAQAPVNIGSVAAVAPSAVAAPVQAAVAATKTVATKGAKAATATAPAE